MDSDCKVTPANISRMVYSLVADRMNTWPEDSPANNRWQDSLLYSYIIHCRCCVPPDPFTGGCCVYVDVMGAGGEVWGDSVYNLLYSGNKNEIL